jgi:transposase InsO family protein
LQTTLTPAQEVVAVALRKTLLVSLDDLLAVVREFLNPNVSRSGLDRCLRRHGVGNLRDLKVKEARPKHSAFKAYAPGYLHIDVKYLPQMADQTSRRYLFVAIDRATRWVFIGIYSNKTAANARRFLRDLERACPLHIRTILTDNGKEFTDRLFGLRKRAATGKHEFDTLCTELGIDHRLTPPQSPQTNGMVERFNGRIEDVLQSHHFRSGEDLNATMHRYVLLYNQQLPQSVLQSRTPLQAMKDWHKLKPELFKKNPYYLTGCDTHSLAEHRWPEGFVCPSCGTCKGWPLKRSRATWECAGCARQTFVTAGTVMHSSHLPLRIWCLAAHIITSHSIGMSAQHLQAQLGLGSYKTGRHRRSDRWRFSATSSCKSCGARWSTLTATP